VGAALWPASLLEFVEDVELSVAGEELFAPVATD